MILDNIIKSIVGFVWNFGPKILYSIIVLLVGFWIVKKIANLVDRRLSKNNSDLSLRHFLTSLVSIVLKTLVIISSASMLGIATTSFVALLGAAGLAIGLALQGSLANFAGGVLILMFKPFRVGDVIEAQGFSGSVKKIEIFNTILTTPDNKTIIIPNGKLSNDAITNFSKEKLRRVDLSFGISYDDDIKLAKKVLDSIVKKHKLILKDPEPFVRLGKLDESSVNFTLRLWVKKEDYWSVFFDMQETVKLEFDKAKLSMPYPQMDIHMNKL